MSKDRIIVYVFLLLAKFLLDYHVFGLKTHCQISVLPANHRLVKLDWDVKKTPKTRPYYVVEASMAYRISAHIFLDLLTS